MDTQPLITLDNISFRYNGDPVLEGITLSVKQGDFLGIIGPNGSGKTTLLKIMLGLLTPQSGTVLLFGQPVSNFSDWSKIGYVPQKAGSASIKFPITVEEVVSMGRGSVISLPFLAQKDESLSWALSAVGMESLRKKPLRELSGGQQQRVFIARAIVSHPELLILDEPTVGVDVDSQSTFYDLLKELNQKHKLTLVLVSHDIDVVAHEVKTVACINKTLIFHGQPHEMIEREIIEKLYGKSVRFVVHGH